MQSKLRNRAPSSFSHHPDPDLSHAPLSLPRAQYSRPNFSERRSAPGFTYSWLSRDSAGRLAVASTRSHGWHCRGLGPNRNHGSVLCGGPQAFFGPRPPTAGSRRVRVGSEPSAISLAPGATPATRPGRFCQTPGSGWHVLVPIGHGLIGPRRDAARSLGCLSRWWGEPGGHSQVRQPAEVNTLVKQGSALLPLTPAPPPAPEHQGDGWICKSPAQQGYGGRDRV